MSKEQCKEKADLRYTWPGKDEAVICIKHAHGIKHIANAMGLHLQMISLSEKQLEHALQCNSFI